MNTILDQIRSESAPAPGSLTFQGGTITWNHTSVVVDLLAGRPFKFDTHAPGIVQLSRTTKPPADLKRPRKRAEYLHVSLRGAGGALLRLCVPVKQLEALQGLPHIDDTGVAAELEPVLEMLRAARALGTGIAQAGTHEEPRSSSLPVPEPPLDPVAKLEAKVAELERQIAEAIQAEERVEELREEVADLESQSQFRVEQGEDLRIKHENCDEESLAEAAFAELEANYQALVELQTRTSELQVLLNDQRAIADEREHLEDRLMQTRLKLVRAKADARSAEAKRPQTVSKATQKGKEKPDKDTSSKSAPALLALILGLFVASLFFMPASWCARVLPTDWQFRSATLIPQDSGAPLLLVEMEDSFDQLVVVELGSGEVLGKYVAHQRKGTNREVFAVTSELVWIRDSRDMEVYALTIPELEEAYELDDLFDEHEELEDLVQSVDGDLDSLIIDAADGHQYRWRPRDGGFERIESGPVYPFSFYQGNNNCGQEGVELIDGERVLNAFPLCASATGKELRTADQGQIIHHSTLETETGKLLLSHVSNDGKLLWSRAESDWLEPLDAKEHGRVVNWSMLVGEDLVLVLSDEDQIHVVALEIETGDKKWLKSFD